MTRPASLRFLRISLTASFAIFAVTASANPGRGGQVAIFPKRVVFSDRLRTADVTLVNQGNQPLTYRIELIEQRMTPAGMLEPVPAPGEGESSAIHLIRHSPRQVTLAPGAPQTVRLLLRKPADLAPGEYRVHLLCRALPAQSEGNDVEAPSGGEGLAVRLIPLPAVSIPILVRHGEGFRASVRISNLAFDPGSRMLSFHLEREGEISVYGDVTAIFEPADGGPEQIVAKARGVAVYTDLTSVGQRLKLDPGSPVSQGRLRLRFTSRPEDDGGGPALSAEDEVQVP